MRIAVVSGASSGMGREFVKIIDQKCSHLDEIWVMARRKERLQKLQFHVHHPLRIFDLDLSQETSIYQMQAVMDQKKPKICVLVASAGYGKHGKAETISLEDAMQMVQVNVEALTGLTQMSLPYMVRGGRILLLASSAAFVPEPGFGIYAATKSYVYSYARSLNQELKKRKIYVTAVCPGPVRTEFLKVSGADQNVSPMKKIVTADPKAVVQKAWKDSMERRAVSIYGTPMKCAAVLTKFLPQGIVIKGMDLFL